MAETQDWFDTPTPAQPGDEVLLVDVGGYEGPLDLLLELARKQKVDLAAISVLALAEQYLGFIETVRQKRIDIAADYLVMAAWLAYLKSRLMLPRAPLDDEPSGETLALLLQFRLKRLEAMRHAAGQLMNRPRLGIAVFGRGQPEPIAVVRRPQYHASLYDLLAAYGRQRERNAPVDYTPRLRNVLSLADARDLLSRLIGNSADWIPLEGWLAEYLASPEEQRTVLASSFSASLELVRLGKLEARQANAFGPLLLRRRSDDGAAQ